MQRPPPTQVLAPLGFRNGQLEFLKWFGVATMVLDHVGRLLWGYPTESWVFAASRLAFPLFALVLGVNLARPGDRARRCARTGWRLALWCLVSVVPSVWARDHPLLVNVLGTLALGSWVCWALVTDAALPWRVLAAVGASGAAHYVEFDLPGVLLVATVFLWGLQPRVHTALLAALMLLTTAWLNATFGGVWAFVGTVAVVPVALAARTLPLALPRVQWLFYLFYPLHLAVIGAARQAWIG